MTHFIKFDSNTDVNSDLRWRKIGDYHAANIRKIALGGIEAASEYSTKFMGGISPRSRPSFSKKLLELCKDVGDMAPYIIVDNRVCALCLTWEFKSKKSSIQIPVIMYK